MAVSLKQMAESIEQIRLGQHRHWMSPYCVADKHKSTVGGVEVFKHNRTVTRFQVLNPSSSKQVSVKLNFFGGDNELKTDMFVASNFSNEFLLPSRAAKRFEVIDLFVGWLEIIATGPIFPSGHVAADATITTEFTGTSPPMQSVGFAMHFYPVAEAQ